MPVLEALGASWEYLVLTVQGYLNLFNPATAGETLSQSTSVVGIAVMSERAASAGIPAALHHRNRIAVACRREPAAPAAA